VNAAAARLDSVKQPDLPAQPGGPWRSRRQWRRSRSHIQRGQLETLIDSQKLRHACTFHVSRFTTRIRIRHRGIGFLSFRNFSVRFFGASMASQTIVSAPCSRNALRFVPPISVRTQPQIRSLSKTFGFLYPCTNWQTECNIQCLSIGFDVLFAILLLNILSSLVPFYTVLSILCLR
jgi:hypothetical protein